MTLDMLRDKQSEAVTKALLQRQAFFDRSIALIGLFFVLKVVEALDVAQLQAGIDLLPLNSEALKEFKTSTGQSKTVLEVAFLSALLVPSTVKLLDAFRAVSLPPRVWKSRFPALAPEIDKSVQALDRNFDL